MLRPCLHLCYRMSHRPSQRMRTRSGYPSCRRRRRKRQSHPGTGLSGTRCGRPGCPPRLWKHPTNHRCPRSEVQDPPRPCPSSFSSSSSISSCSFSVPFFLPLSLSLAREITAASKNADIYINIILFFKTSRPSPFTKTYPHTISFFINQL